MFERYNGLNLVNPRAAALVGLTVLASCGGHADGQEGPMVTEAVAPTTTVADTLVATTTTELLPTTTTIQTVESTTTSTVATTVPETTTTIAAAETTVSVETTIPEVIFGVEDFTIGESVGHIRTSDGNIDIGLNLTDFISSPRLPVVVSPELDHVHDGAGVSAEYGLPVEGNHAVILAHNTTAGRDFFRYLSQVQKGTILEVVLNTPDGPKLQRYESVIEPTKVDRFQEGAQFIYNRYDDGKPHGDSTVTLFTCDTVNGEPNSRMAIIFKMLKD